MAVESEVNILLSNIIDEKCFSHCRLCLKSIQGDNYAKFEDCVEYSGSYTFTKVTEIIEKLLGQVN